MNVVKATKGDLNAWLEMAAEVEDLFGPMISDPRFIQAINQEMKAAGIRLQMNSMVGLTIN